MTYLVKLLVRQLNISKIGIFTHVVAVSRQFILRMPKETVYYSIETTLRQSQGDLGAWV